MKGILVDKEKIKVCHIITELAIGGAHDNTLLTVERLNRDIYEPFLITSRNGGFVDRAIKGGYPLLFMTQLKREPSPIDDFFALVRLIELFRKHRFHIVHTHSAKAGFLGRLAAYIANVPCVVHTVHGWPFNDFMNPVKAFVFRLAETISAFWCKRMLMVCELNRQEALDLSIAPANKMTTVYSGIDFSRIDAINRTMARIEIQKRHNIDPDNMIVGVLARLFPQKAPHIFVETAEKILKIRKNVTFIFVGDGPLKEETEELIKEKGLEKSIILAGWRHDVDNYLGSFDVFLLTSLWEGLGRAITEAAYSGVPMVASKVNGVPEIVRDNETGFLFEPRNTDHAAELVLKLLEDNKLRQKLGSSSRDKIAKQFDIKVMVDSIEKIYAGDLQDIFGPMEIFNTKENSKDNSKDNSTKGDS